MRQCTWSLWHSVFHMVSIWSMSAFVIIVSAAAIFVFSSKLEGLWGQESCVVCLRSPGLASSLDAGEFGGSDPWGGTSLTLSTLPLTSSIAVDFPKCLKGGSRLMLVLTDSWEFPLWVLRTPQPGPCQPVLWQMGTARYPAWNLAPYITAVKSGMLLTDAAILRSPCSV